MFDELLFNPTEGGKYRLECPQCGREDQAEINGVELTMLSFRGENSLCIDCDPSANDPVQFAIMLYAPSRIEQSLTNSERVK